MNELTLNKALELFFEEIINQINKEYVLFKS